MFLKIHDQFILNQKNMKYHFKSIAYMLVLHLELWIHLFFIPISRILLLIITIVNYFNHHFALYYM